MGKRKMYKLPERVFGPMVYHEPDGSFRAVCHRCVFNYSTRCGDVGNDLPASGDTPDWCKMKEGMLADVRAAVGK